MLTENVENMLYFKGKTQFAYNMLNSLRVATLLTQNRETGKTVLPDLHHIALPPFAITKIEGFYKRIGGDPRDERQTKASLLKIFFSPYFLKEERGDSRESFLDLKVK